ncbi:hypothetical protein OM427_03185 [Halomonas sp. 18H]|nr:hypothetical protein [Halomonas sp. 18H]MCW4148536.1 hypothetical protein [Halomonas sp. 18H]
MKEEAKIEAIEQKNKGYNYWPLAFPVLVTAIVAIGAYVINFWGLQPSDKPNDWAAFATYVSGTVGVAAVVATLFAFVITLRQQQKLINSQDKQLDIAKQQLYLAESKEAVERAYGNSLNVLPLIIESLSDRSEKEFPDFSSNEFVEVWNCVPLFQRMNYVDILANTNVLKMALENGVITSRDVESFVEDYFSEVRDICLMSFEQVNVNPDVYYVFDSYMKKDLGMGKDVWHLVRCYCSYKLGREDFEFVEKANMYLNFKKREAGDKFEWFGLGQCVNDNVGEIAW